jgi:hypothetical protein
MIATKGKAALHDISLKKNSGAAWLNGENGGNPLRARRCDRVRSSLKYGIMSDAGKSDQGM